MRTATIDFKEGEYRIKTLEKPCEKEQAYRLRYKIFFTELGWINYNTKGEDIDSFDGNDTSLIGVIDPTTSQLVALLRITLPNTTFMMEKNFHFLLKGHKIEKTPEVIEVSRVCTERTIRTTTIENRFGNYSIAMLLYKGLYQWSRKNRVTTIYMVIEEKLNRLLSISGFPTQTINDPYTMPDGIKAVAVKLDWRDFTKTNKRNRQRLLFWYSSSDSSFPSHPLTANLSTHHVSLLLRPGNDLRP